MRVRPRLEKSRYLGVERRFYVAGSTNVSRCGTATFSLQVLGANMIELQPDFGKDEGITAHDSGDQPREGPGSQSLYSIVGELFDDDFGQGSVVGAGEVGLGLSRGLAVVKCPERAISFVASDGGEVPASEKVRPNVV
jgi:hypothetical protein